MNTNTNRSLSRLTVPVLSPFDVQLDQDDKTIVQPDLLVVCRKKGRDMRKRLHGAPEFVFEMLSPSTREKDLNKKVGKYAAAGVKECWIIDPDEQTIAVYDFENLKFPVIYTFDWVIPLIQEGFYILHYCLIANQIHMRKFCHFLKQLSAYLHQTALF